MHIYGRRDVKQMMTDISTSQGSDQHLKSIQRPDGPVMSPMYGRQTGKICMCSAPSTGGQPT